MLQQGLLKKQTYTSSYLGVSQVLQQLAYVQIDTLSVVERAHHHTLWNRIPNYKKAFLDDAVERGEAFEYWFHAAAYLPMQDYRFALPRMNGIRRGESPWYKDVDPKVMGHVLERISEEGPLKGRDFESEKKNKGSWWNWKPSKKALEKLYMQGDLMISKRVGMEKIYDLRERVLPSGLDNTEPTLLEFAEYLVDASLKAHGFTTIKQIAHLRKGALLKKLITEVLNRKIEEKEIVELEIEGMPLIYLQANLMELSFSAPPKKVRILSPFDNAIIHRDRLEYLFDFDYRIECYTPVDKRQFGYFCLPILYGDSFVGRVDCKAHRDRQTLELIQLHIEPSAKLSAALLDTLIREIKKFVRFNNCNTVQLTKVSPSKFSKEILAKLN